jgi:hypothetical protein
MKNRLHNGWITPLLLLAAFIVMRLAGCTSGQNDPLSDATMDSDSKISPTPPATDGSLSSDYKYKLTIRGLPAGKAVPTINDNDPHKIFVPLYGTTRINLQEGPFAVLDADGTDGSALFELPNPDPSNTGASLYSVFVKSKAKKGRWGSLTTCATDDSGNTYCSLNQLLMVPHGTKKINATKYLLYLYADIDTNGTIDRVPLFDARLQDYYWEYDNNGLKKIQLKFKPVSTRVP